MKSLVKLALILFASGLLLSLSRKKAGAPAGMTNPGGTATPDELSYSAYLTAGDGSRRMDFADWAAAGKPPR